MTHDPRHPFLPVLLVSLLASAAAFAQKPRTPRPATPIGRQPAVAPVASQPTAAPLPGTDAFHRVFQPSANGRSDANAYMLGYLATAIYPAFLDEMVRQDLDDNRLNRDAAYFERQFVAATRHLFYDPAKGEAGAPTFRFVRSDDREGYDPEAMVIGTPECVFVVFRGTDRVAGARSDFGYEWNEWLKSDFQFNAIAPGDGLNGLVHAGFWNSLSAIKRQLGEQVEAMGGRHKMVWIAGHSLGAAHAQVFAAWLVGKQGVEVQGCYAFAAPHVGNEQFVAELDGMLPRGRLQRFEFVDDPVTMLPPYVLGYRRAGVRVYYDDLESLEFDAPERSPIESLKLAGAALGVATNAIEGGLKSTKVYKLNLAGGGFCYHYPAWYLGAAFRQLNRTQRAQVPPRPALPRATELACSDSILARGRENPVHKVAEAVEDAGEAVQAAVETLRFNAAQLLKNANGDAIQNGVYTLRCLRGGKALRRDNTPQNGDKLELWDHQPSAGRQQFTIKKDGALGYTVETGGRFLEVAAEDLLDNGGKLQLWDANLPLNGHAPNQKWLFYKLGNSRYLLVNMGSTKVLDAVNKDTGKNGGMVQQWRAVDDDQSQVWIVERAQ